MDTLVCDWDGGTTDVRESKGEMLCVHCRYSVSFMAILGSIEGVRGE
jgi:hypothetical protein